MQRDLTVFVVGAGASAQFGLPAGATFNDKVVSSLLNDAPNIVQEVSGIRSDHTIAFDHPNRREATKFARQFQNSGYSSIDSFLSARQRGTDALTPLQIAWSKTAINRAISDGEHVALRLPQTYQSWISKVFEYYERCRDKKTYDDGSAVRLITFNYDRIIEHALATMIANSRGVDPSEAFKEATSVVHHVYGMLPTSYSWDHDRQCFCRGTRLGPLLTTEQVDAAEKSIFVVGDERLRNDAFIPRNKARQLLYHAHECFFLGFGFSPENLHHLSIRKQLSGVARIGSTGRSLSPAARSSIEQLLCTKESPSIEWGRPDGDCNSYFGNDAIL